MDQNSEEQATPLKLPLDTPNSTSVEFPAKRLARQLVFTAACSPSEAMAFPESPLFLHAPPQPSSPLMFSPTPQPIVVHSSSRILKPESPLSRGRPTGADSKDGTPKKQKQCNCKHSKCLKLYCECFASGIYCDGCNCVNCYNNVENDVARREAVDATLERNPNAFRPKIASSPYSSRDCREEAADSLVLAKHNKGCHCKKSGCLKKYCECFQANILCSENCKCMDCKNFEGSEERQALFHGDHANTFSHIQQSANAAITGAIGSSGYGSSPPFKKRKNHDLNFGSAIKDRTPLRFPQFQQLNNIKASSPLLPSIPSGRTTTNAAAFGPSKFTYRSLLADIIQPHDLRELCSVLVVVSKEAADAYQDMKSMKEKSVEQDEASVASSPHETGKDCLNRNVDDMRNAELSSRRPEDKQPPMSPGTMELMCDERDTIFMAPATSPNGSVDRVHSRMSHFAPEKPASDMYADQERVVLLKFRDCLNRLISFGEIKETKWSCSPMMGEASRSPHQPEPTRIDRVSNGSASPAQISVGRARPYGGNNNLLLTPNGVLTNREVKTHIEKGMNG